MNQNRISQYLESRRERLQLLEAMWNDPKVQLYNDVELPPKDDAPSVFLNGPTSRHQILEFNHRCLSVKYLRDAGFNGWIYAPEPRGHEEPGDFTERGYIHEWESSRRFSASCNSFWIPRDSNELLGLNSNLELGIDIGKLLARTQNHRPHPHPKPAGHVRTDCTPREVTSPPPHQKPHGFGWAVFFYLAVKPRLTSV